MPVAHRVLHERISVVVPLRPRPQHIRAPLSERRVPRQVVHPQLRAGALRVREEVEEGLVQELDPVLALLEEQAPPGQRGERGGVKAQRGEVRRRRRLRSNGEDAQELKDSL